MSITLNGSTYAVTYIDDATLNLSQPQSGSRLSVDAWGVDTLTRPYKWRIDQMGRLAAALRRNRGFPDFAYRALTLDKWTITENGPWAEAELTFKGTFDGQLPAPIISSGMRRETVTLNYADGTGSAEQPAIELTYMSPYTRFRYVSRTPPTKPRYAGELRGSKEILLRGRRGGIGEFVLLDGGQTGFSTASLAQQIQGAIFAFKNNGTPLGREIEDILAGSYFGVKITLTTNGPTVEPAGVLYECEEENQRMIIDLDLGKSGQLIIS